MNYLYWLYLWQNKEYRRDRFALYWRELSERERLGEYLFGHLRRPRLSPKMMGLMLVSGVMIFAVLGMLFLIGFPWFLLVPVWFLVVPPAVSLSVGLFAGASAWVVRHRIGLARRKRLGFPALRVVGVTGSYGKTTTKEAIAAVLSGRYRVLKTPGGVNTAIGIANQILRELSAEIEVYVVEVGAYRRGEIAEVVWFIQPQVGVLTGVSEQHLGLFGSLENTKRAKFELIDGLPKDGVAVLNVADANVQGLLDQVKVEVRKYESTQPADNRRAAVEIARYFGMSEAEIEHGLQQIKPVAGRLTIEEFKMSGRRLVLLDDSYASNSAGFLAALKVLGQRREDHKLVVTTGIYEAGNAADQLHQETLHEIGVIGAAVRLVEAHHARYWPNVKLVQEFRPVRDEILGLLQTGDLVILLEGRHRVINQILNWVRKLPPVFTSVSGQVQ